MASQLPDIIKVALRAYIVQLRRQALRIPLARPALEAEIKKAEDMLLG